MTELQNLKEECLQKQKTVEELNGSLCEKIILRDINILKKNDSTIMSGSDRNKFYKDKLIITVTSKGMLEIEIEEVRHFYGDLKSNTIRIFVYTIFLNSIGMCMMLII
jgi:tRNA splicing endonuclease